MSDSFSQKFGRFNFSNLKDVLFFIICWYFGIRTINIGLANLDFSKPDEINSLFLIISAIGLLLILLPFFTRIKVGEFEIEREIEQAKRDLAEFKNETRNTIAIMSSQITTVAAIKNQNQVTVYIPGYEEANAELKQKIHQSVEKEAEDIKDEFLENQDSTMAVLKIRVQLEYLLRKLLEKRVTINDVSKEIKFMSLLKMSREFIKNYPDFQYLQKSLDYVREVGNAAAHAQCIPESQAQEIIDIGSKLIAILFDLAKNEGIL